jgi:hypothetical protein
MDTLPQTETKTYQLMALSSAINLMERAYKGVHEAQCPRSISARSVLERVGADLDAAGNFVRQARLSIKEGD